MICASRNEETPANAGAFFYSSFVRALSILLHIRLYQADDIRL